MVVHIRQFSTGAVMGITCCCGPIMVIPATPCPDPRNDGHAGTEADPYPHPHPAYIYFDKRDVVAHVSSTTHFYVGYYQWCYTLNPATTPIPLPDGARVEHLAATPPDTGCDTCAYEVHFPTSYGYSGPYAGVGALGCMDALGTWIPGTAYGSVAGSFTATFNGTGIDAGLTSGLFGPSAHFLSQTGTDTFTFTTNISSWVLGSNDRTTGGEMDILNTGCKPLCITWTVNGVSTTTTIEPGQAMRRYEQFITWIAYNVDYVITCQISCGGC